MKIQDIYLEDMKYKKTDLFKILSPQSPRTQARPNGPEAYIPDWALGEDFNTASE